MTTRRKAEVAEAVVGDYLAGALIGEIADRHAMSRETVIAILRIDPRVPNRFRREKDAEAEQLAAALRELARHLEVRLTEVEAENRSLRRALKVAERSRAKAAS
jgi:hypothetical protein